MSAIPDAPGLTALGGRPTRLGPGPARSALRIAGLTVLVAVAFVAGQTPYRHLEAVMVYAVVRAVGFHGVITVEGSQVLLQSHAGQLFWVDITPSCSSLAPALALALVATIMSVGNPTSDRLLAGVIGVASIIVGNLVRIGSSVVVGLLAGRVSLVLFHDWVGSTFGFAYTVGGFVLLLGILLRRRTPARGGSVSRSVVLLVAVGSLLIALGLGWRLLVTWRIRNRLISLLGSPDSAIRAGTLTLLVAEGLERFAPALRRMSETETDPDVLRALAEAVNRTQVMPARTPDLISLRLWAATRPGAATHPGTVAPPARPASIPSEGVAISNGSATDGGAGRHRQPAPSTRSASVTPETTPPASVFVPASAAATNGKSAGHAVATGGSAERRPTVVPRPEPSAERRPVAVPRPEPAESAAGEAREARGARDARVVLVTGAGGPAGVAVIRALRRAGHRVVACDADAYAVGFRLADEFAQVPRADDPAFIESVIKAVARSGAVALISTVTEELAPLHTATLPLVEAGAGTWLPDPWSVRHCADKWLFHELMTKHGIPVPATGLGSEDGVPGPWIVKPRFGRGSRDVYDAADADDLAYALRHAPEPLVQSKIIGREFTVDTLSGRNGRLYGAVPRWRVETKAGISTKGITFDDPELVGKVTELLGVLRLEGPACVQGFRTDEGQLVFIEANPRFSGGLPLSLAAGADLVGQCLNRILGGVVQSERLRFRFGVTMLRYFDEVFEE